MSHWCFFLIVFLSLLQTCLLSSSSSQICLHDERYALLQFKQRHYHYDPNYQHHLKSWNKLSTDCCYWEGITCDGTTGHVVGLELFNSSLNGSIHSNSTLFCLLHLQMLNLSWNDFDYFSPSGFNRLSRLMHLNLSGNHFSGQIPSQSAQLTDLVSLDLSFNCFMGQIPFGISRLTKLVFLDFSDYIYNSTSQLEISNLRAFVQNLSRLRELRLDGVDLSAQKNRDWCHHLSSALPNLHVLSMRNCSLTGPLDASISSLRSLSELYLELNQNLFSTVPSSLVNLTSLTILGIGDCGFHGDFPSNVFLHLNLREIDLSDNPLLSVQLPEFPQVNNSSLQYLYVGNTKFQGKIPVSVGNLKLLKGLSRRGCNLSGPIPPFLANLTNLILLDLSSNSLSGQILSFFRGSFPNLEYLFLGDNLLQGPIPSYLFTRSLPSLSILFLSINQFSGVIINEEPYRNISVISSPQVLSKSKTTSLSVYLSGNDFGYMAEDANHSYDSRENFLNNTQIGMLEMSSCNISQIPEFFRNQKELTVLELSNNRISKFPDFLRDLKSLRYLGLSSNGIDGAIPKWIWQLQNLSRLELFNNSLTGLEMPLPTNHSFNIEYLDLDSNKIQDCLPTAPCSPQSFNQSNSDQFVSPILGNLIPLLSKATFYFSISDNKLTGKIPLSICNASNLEVLDLSNNQLSGTIPFCLASSTNLGVLNLESNKLHGSIPPAFKNGCILYTLKLNNNTLRGKVPRSLGNCKELKVLDIGYNQLNDTFPCWFENLSELQVLVMRSNNFGGSIGQLSHVDSPFPNLHVIDLSFNAFTGDLPWQYILHWRAMMTTENNSDLTDISFSNSQSYYQDTVAIVYKGLYLEMPRILTTLITIDLSNNSFKGEIPDALGDLKALKVLNLSGNSLTGEIPFSLGNLSELESLDLSRNELSGKIPRQLTSLTFLSVFNVSYNKLVGGIPQGSQFDTFSNASYEGNAGLCGFPLSRKCGITKRALPPASTSQQKDDSRILLDQRFVVAGCCSGLIIGLVVGQQLFWRNNRYFRWIFRIKGSKQKKGLKKKHHNRRK